MDEKQLSALEQCLHGKRHSAAVEVSEVRDLGKRILAIGHARIRGKESGVRIESPFCILTESKGTKGRATRATLIRTYVDLDEALEAAGLSK